MFDKNPALSPVSDRIDELETDSLLSVDVASDVGDLYYASHGWYGYYGSRMFASGPKMYAYNDERAVERITQTHYAMVCEQIAFV